MSRPSTRRVRIVLSGRDPKDPAAILSAVREAFNPKEIEITHHSEVSAVDDHSRVVPDEELETKATSEAKSALDLLAEAAAQHNRLKPDQFGLVLSDPKAILAQRQGVLTWIAQRLAAGYAFTVYWSSRGTVAEILDRVKK